MDFTRYTKESLGGSPEYSANRGKTPSHAYRRRSLWRETRLTIAMRSSWQKSRGYEHQPFKAVPNQGIHDTCNLSLENMVIHSRLFPTTLIGVALEWYYSFPRNLVDSFNTLCAQFLARFIDFNPIVATSTSLHNVVQGEGEGLRQYMTRFSQAMVNMPNLHPTMRPLCWFMSGKTFTHSVLWTFKGQWPTTGKGSKVHQHRGKCIHFDGRLWRDHPQWLSCLQEEKVGKVQKLYPA